MTVALSNCTVSELLDSPASSGTRANIAPEPRAGSSERVVEMRPSLLRDGYDTRRRP